MDNKIETRIKERLQELLDNMVLAEKNNDTYFEKYWTEYYMHAQSFAEDITGKKVILEKITTLSGEKATKVVLRNRRR